MEYVRTQRDQPHEIPTEFLASFHSLSFVNRTLGKRQHSFRPNLMSHSSLTRDVINEISTEGAKIIFVSSCA